MKILIAPDKFKGSLTALQVCEAVREGINKYNSTMECSFHPLADGGEGTLEILGDALRLETAEIEVSDPLFRPIRAGYKFSSDTAFIEMSKASGLQLLNSSERNCMNTTTYGTGELIMDAIQRGIQKIYLFVGGSATNEAGLGMAAALGYRFLDQQGGELKGIGRELIDLQSIDRSNVMVDLSAVQFTVVCDVKNPFYGPEGASYTYGAQKGASPEEIRSLDEGLKNTNEVILKTFGTDLSTLEGAGAAGGIAGGAVAFLNASLLSGIHSVMEITSFESKLNKTDLVITGEGKIDHQTIHGKVVDGVYQMAEKYGKDLAIVCGVMEHEDLVAQKIKAPVYQIKDDHISVEEAIANGYDYLVDRAYQLISDYVKKNP